MSEEPDILKKLLVEPGQEFSITIAGVKFRWFKPNQIETELATKPHWQTLVKKIGKNKFDIDYEKIDDKFRAKLRYYIYAYILIEPKELKDPEKLMKLDPKYGNFLIPKLEETIGIGQNVEVTENF